MESLFTRIKLVKNKIQMIRRLALLFLVAFVSSGSFATVFNVTDFSDGHNTNQLRGAIEAADLAGGTHTINLQAGTYNLTLGTIYFGNSPQNITITGAGASLTIINMTTTLQDRIFAINYDGIVNNVVTSISGVKFQNGYLNFDTYGGAAIYAGPYLGNVETLTITDCAFDNNICPGAAGSGGIGGAIYMFQGTLNISNSSFTNNKSIDGNGGAIIYLLYNLDPADDGMLNITNATFSNNSAGGNGGAIAFSSQGSSPAGQTFTVDINKNTFTGNTATGYGGAISANNSGNFPTQKINYNRFAGNVSTASATTSGLHFVHSAGGVNAENNWWGCNTGPTAGTCDKASGVGAPGAGVLAAGKWLQLKVSASVNPICNNVPSGLGNTSLITAGFLTNSANESIALSDLSALIGLPVTWSQTLGSLSGQQTAIQSTGTASATFTSNGTGGTATVNAQVDNVPATETAPARASITVNTISIAPTGVTGTTTICSGGNTTLTVSGGSMGTSAIVEWFTGSCGGTPAGTGNSITVSPSSDETYYVRYNGTCNTTNCTSVLVTVSPANTISRSSAAGTDAQELCINTSISDITYATTGATGATVSGLPAGVTGGWAGDVVTISGTPTASGTFNYTVTLTGGCGAYTASGSITVHAVNSIALTSASGTDAQTVCSGAAITDITYSSTGATGATVTGLPPGVTGSWAADLVTISGTPTTTGNFSYTVTLTGGCGLITAIGSINVSTGNTITLTSAPGTDAQNLLVNTAINNITYVTTGATGATVTGLPAGVTGNWAANLLTISGTPTATGSFNYTVTLTGGCGSNTTTGSINVFDCNISLSSPAGTDGQTVCNNSAITNITYATSGATGASFSGLPAGVSGNWSANVATISGTPSASGSYNYTVTLTGSNCGSFQATGSITVNQEVTAGTSGNTTVCEKCEHRNETSSTLLPANKLEAPGRG